MQTESLPNLLNCVPTSSRELYGEALDENDDANKVALRGLTADTTDSAERDPELGEQGFSWKRNPGLNRSFTTKISKFRQPRPIFPDKEELMKRVRNKLVSNEEFNRPSLHKRSGIASAIAQSQWFENLTLVVIAVNAVWIAVDTDLNKAPLLVDAHIVFQVMEHFFCTYFFLEWIIKFFAYERKRDLLKDYWFLFDSILVLNIIIETWVMTVVLKLTGGTKGGGLRDASTLRVFRLLRLTRVARMARLLRVMPELMIIIKGMFTAARSVAMTMGLLFVVIYIFGIAFTQLTAGSEVGHTHFSSVPRSMYTLLLRATLLDEPGVVLTELGCESYFNASLMVLVIVLSSFTIMNLLIGVLCEVVSSVSAAEKEAIAVSSVKEKVIQVLSAHGLDQNGDGLISKEELHGLAEHEEAAKHLQDAGIDVVGLLDLADVIFQSDLHGHEFKKKLNFAEFMDLVLQLRGTNAATVKDIVDLRKFVHTKTTLASNQMARVEDRLRRLDRNINVACNSEALVQTPSPLARNEVGLGGSSYLLERKTVPVCMPTSPAQVGHDLDDSIRTSLVALEECVSMVHRELQSIRLHHVGAQGPKKKSRLEQSPLTSHCNEWGEGPSKFGENDLPAPLEDDCGDFTPSFRNSHSTGTSHGAWRASIPPARLGETPSMYVSSRTWQ